MDDRTREEKAQIRVLPASVPLFEEAARLLVPEGLDFSGNLVVFPGKRPSHFVRRHIAQQTGGSYIPPVIFSMEEFVDSLYGKVDAGSTRKLETIDAVAFLFELHRSMASPLGGTEFLSLEAFFPLGLRIYRDIEELTIECVEAPRLKAVEPLFETPLPARTGGDLQTLSFFYERFYPAIKDAGFSSRSERYGAVSSAIAKGDLLPYGRIVFAGFYAFTESERRLFSTLLSRENVCFLFTEGPGLARRLESLGISEKPEVNRDEGRKTVSFCRSADVHGEAFALATVLSKGAEEAHEDGPSTVIVLPSAESLFPVLHHALPLAGGEGYNISLGYPLERTPVWGFLANLMQAVSSMDEDRVYVPDYLGFMLHPYTKNIYMDGRTEATRIMLHALEETLQEDRTRSFVSLPEIEARTEVFTRAAERLPAGTKPACADDLARHLKGIHDDLIRRASSFRDIADFAAKLSAILTLVYDKSSARLHPFFHPFVESFLKELDLLGRSRVKNLSFTDRNGYFHFFRRYVAHCLTPFEGTPLQGVQVLGFLETRALRFERAYIMDANEDVLPDTRKEETLLPFKVRQVLGLPTYVDRDMISAYYFDTLVRGASEVHIFFVENDRKEKSRFVERLLWERQRAEGRISGRYVTTGSYRLSLENRPPAPVGKSPSVARFLAARPYDATSLDAYLKCPLRFYYRYVLGLSKKEPLSPDIERLDIGRLVHDVLLRYFGNRLGRPLTEGDIDRAAMARAVSGAFEEAYGPSPIGSAYLLRRQVLRQMEAFLFHYQAAVVARVPVTLLALEERLTTTFEGFRLTGIIDRTEKRGETPFIIDYKISASPKRLAIDFDRLDPADRANLAEAVGSLQLPFYLLLYENAGRAAQGETEAMFLLLGKTHVDEKIEAPLSESGRMTEDYGKAREVILRLMREIADPNVPFSADCKAKDACLYCDYRYLCGTQWQG